MKARARKDLAERLATQIIDIARARSMRAGDPLREESFAEALGVSRSPVRRGFELLEELGIATKEPYRGYFLNRDAASISNSGLPEQGDAHETLYLRVVDDILHGVIDTSFFEAELLRLYKVPRGQLLKVLSRLANEAMIERKPGQGWKTNTFLHNADAHIQSYRFRMAIEPFAILEPGYKVNSAAFSKARHAQQGLLDGDIFKLSRAQLFEINSQFHELLVECSGNVFLLEALRRQNQLRRFMAYRANFDHARVITQCQEHLQLLDMIEAGSREEAADFLRHHLDVVSRMKAATDIQLESQRHTLSPTRSSQQN